MPRRSSLPGATGAAPDPVEQGEKGEGKGQGKTLSTFHLLSFLSFSFCPPPLPRFSRGGRDDSKRRDPSIPLTIPLPFAPSAVGRKVEGNPSSLFLTVSPLRLQRKRKRRNRKKGTSLEDKNERCCPLLRPYGLHCLLPQASPS